MFQPYTSVYRWFSCISFFNVEVSYCRRIKLPLIYGEKPSHYIPRLFPVPMFLPDQYVIIIVATTGGVGVTIANYTASQIRLAI